MWRGRENGGNFRGGFDVTTSANGLQIVPPLARAMIQSADIQAGRQAALSERKSRPKRPSHASVPWRVCVCECGRHGHGRGGKYRVQVAAAFVRGGAEDGVKTTGVAGSGVGATVDAVTADAAGMVLRHTLTAMGPYVRCKTGVIGENTHLFSLLPLPPPSSPPSSPSLDAALDGDGAAAGGGGGVLALLTKQMTLVVRLGSSMQVVHLNPITVPTPHPHQPTSDPPIPPSGRAWCQRAHSRCNCNQASCVDSAPRNPSLPITTDDRLGQPRSPNPIQPVAYDERHNYKPRWEPGL